MRNGERFLNTTMESVIMNSTFEILFPSFSTNHGQVIWGEGASHYVGKIRDRNQLFC